MHGLEPVLEAELRAIGAEDIQLLNRAVQCTGDQRLLYRANYELRTALRVFVPIHSFTARNEEMFYGKVRDIDWRQYMDVSQTLAIDAQVHSETFRHSQYMALTTKDAIVDQFRDRFDRRPDVNVVAPDLRIHLRINRNDCQILLDSSGDSLHKRGYRRDGLEAPINEVLAAGMLLLAGWPKQASFVDPMCGSGTLAVEAAMIAGRVPPQHNREYFGLTRWKDFDKKLWAQVRTTANSHIQAIEKQIVASDMDPKARNATAINFMAAGLEKSVQIGKSSFQKLEPPAEAGLLMTNPPYDERLQLVESDNFYKMIGSTLKERWQGWEAWLISSNKQAMNGLGLKSGQKHTLFNGTLECFFNQYELYGSPDPLLAV